MPDFLRYFVFAMLPAIAVLIAIHEYGHYRVARACGVKVLRFSIGFGPVLFQWRIKNSDTQFVLSAIPLGGYVKMLDEREAPVPAEEKHLSFNVQPLRRRAAIVAAGPLANLLLAVVLYAVVNWTGVEVAAPVLGSPVAGSVAEQAGLTSGERVLMAGFDTDDLNEVTSFDEVRWTLMRGALEGQDVRLQVQMPDSTRVRERVLRLGQLDARVANEALFQKIGVVDLYSRPVVGSLVDGEAGRKAGLREGDTVLQVDGAPVADAAQLRQLIRTSPRNGAPHSQQWKIRRNGEDLALTVVPALYQDGTQTVGRIGAKLGTVPEFVTVRYGPLDGLWQGVTRTWDFSLLTLKMMGKIVIGQASLKNISGPIAMTDMAGKSAAAGPTYYLLFLAAISVSLGVLNLLPVPVLDGGHLMYYLWEAIAGKALSDVWMERLQRFGVVILLTIMSVAMFNDVTSRLLG